MPTSQDALREAAIAIDGGDFGRAEQIGQQLLRIDRGSPAALHVLGIVARRTGRPVVATDLLGEAIVHDAGDAGLHCELGFAMLDQQRLPEATECFHQAVQLNPKYGDAWLNLGATLDRLEQYEAALPPAERAAALLPDNKFAHFNLGNVLRALGRLDEASAAFQRALQIDHDFASAHWNQACCRLLAGDFATGWKEYEWRAAAGEVQIDSYPYPRWMGQPLDGRTILVHAEQGIGDEILFASCLPDLIARAGQVIVVCDPRLAPLLGRSFPQAIVQGVARRVDLRGAEFSEPIDYQIPIGSLPLHFRQTRDSFPRRRRFLVADRGQVAAWRKRFAELGPGLKVGLSWRAGGKALERRKRTMLLNAWLPVLSTPGVHFINVQYGDCTEEIATLRGESGIAIHDWSDADPLVDLDAFAAKLAALDLVISVGNATVHLAGALGARTFALLPMVPNWRWMLAGEQSVWYSSVRLLRQTKRGDWAPVIAEAAEALAKGGGRRADGGSPTTKTLSRPGPACGELVEPAGPGNPAGNSFDAADAFARALSAFNAGDLAAAEALSKTILDHVPRHAPALNLSGTIARQTGRGELAIRMLQRAAAAADRDPTILCNLAAACREAGDLPAAIVNYRRAIDLDPARADAQFGLGLSLNACSRTEEAIVALEQAVRLDPRLHKAFNFLGGWYLQHSRFVEAEQALRKAVALRPDYMAAHNNLGLALERQRKFAEALASFDRALELDDGCTQAVQNLARVLDGLGHCDVATLVRTTSSRGGVAKFIR